MEDFNTLVQNLKAFDLAFEYCKEGAVQNAIVYTLILGTVCFILTKVTHEYSWVDRIWSIIPILYGLHFLYHQKTCRQIPVSTRQYVMIAFTSMWGLRLTYNFIRKGGYQKGGEDYRWAYIRQRYHWVLVELLNFFFTAYYQLILIMWFSAPIYNAHQTPFGVNDYVVAGLWLAAFLTQVTADQQQWNFQSEKYRLLKQNNNKRDSLPAEYRLGFFKGGLFRYTRHPNFFGEICIWYLQFAFSFNSVGLNWCGLGAVLLNLLFLGSTALTEKISIEKYPDYLIYQKETSMLIPLPYNVQAKRQ